MLQTLLKNLRRRFGNDMDDEFRWLLPPANLFDPAGWDRYWRDQFSHGVAGFVHMFCDDGLLVDSMRANELHTILCVGNGISQEPRALAAAGFDVTALDLSPFATDMARQATPPPEYLKRLLGGRSLETGGQLDFTVGDLCDSTVCPGPFDVIIERRTLQLFVRDHDRAVQAVANRLNPRGIFFSHAHDGGWRPPAPRRHACEDWFAAQGWQRWSVDTRVSERVVWLFVSTG
jgi:SAM-dependent methyltransferase